jgi:hypothetical protein
MTSPCTPAQWLIAEYEATASEYEYYARDDDAESEPGPWASVYVQPIYTFKSVSDAGQPMRVREVDYFDEGRWAL